MKAKLKIDGPKKGLIRRAVQVTDKAGESRGVKQIQYRTDADGTCEVEGKEAEALLIAFPLDFEPADAAAKKVHDPLVRKLGELKEKAARTNRATKGSLEDALARANAAAERAESAAGLVEKLAADYADRMATGGLKKG